MFGSNLTSEQKKLSKELFTVSLSIHMGANLTGHVKTVSALKARMTSEQFAEAFDRYWSKSEAAYRDWYDDGVEPQAVYDTMWYWAQNLELPRGSSWPS